MPTGLHLINSNHMEVLAGALADVLISAENTHKINVFEPDIVLVQSKGMQRWVSLAIAEANGICANVHFPFPNAFVERLCALVADDSETSVTHSRDVLAFRIFDLLPDLLKLSEFRPLESYLSIDDRPLKRFQLCRKLADALDQYAVFRPDWLFAWEGGGNTGLTLPESQKWQALLWQALRSKERGTHRSILQKRLVETLSDPQKWVEGLPGRVCVFGISHLPPFHLQVLEALSQRIPVYLFLLNPCRHYWSDIVSDRQMVRIRNREKTPVNNDALYLERGNRLLATLGVLGKQFFDFIMQSQAHHHELFEDNRQKSLLGRIQQDILDLVDRPSPKEAPPEALTSDGTLRVHSCHSPMREIEVLHDQLLDMMETIPGLQPTEVLVMVPNIGTYAPFIHAVFGNPEETEVRIPYTLADQSVANENASIDAFVQLLDMIGGRLEATSVLNLLTYRSVHKRFNLGESDLPILHRWVRETGIRWGWDGEHRQVHRLPGFVENTWQTGLDRLILGLSMDNREGRLFEDVLPFDAMTAGEGETLGYFALFVEELYNSGNIVDVSDTLDGWAERLHSLFDRFFLIEPHSEHESRPLHSLLDQFAQMGNHLDKRRPIPFEVVRYHLKDILDHSVRESGFMAGGVTFCAMLPMRSIPFKVICLLGMNHDAFPRDNREPGFNLIAAEPRPGDRSKRNDDRYLFLETLISARHVLYLSHIGQSIQDNSPIPPSVVVDDLLEYVGEGFNIPPEEIVVRHPLHSFSSAYFTREHPHLFSYNHANRVAAESMASPTMPVPLFSEPLPAADPNFRQCAWSDLGRFWSHPIRYLFQHRLGVRLKSRGEAVEDRESFKLDALEKYHLNQLLLKSLSAGASQKEVYQIARAANLLPHGTTGRVQFNQQAEAVARFMQTLGQVVPDTTARSVYIEKKIGLFEMHGEISGIYPQGRVVYRMGKTRGKDLLDFFIAHIALHFCDDCDVVKVSSLVCEESIWQIGPLEQAEETLRFFLESYWHGLHTPLPFYSQTSYAYAYQVLVNERDPHMALPIAERTWYGSSYAQGPPGEADDPYHRLCFRCPAMLTDDFEKMAIRIFTPLLSSVKTF